MIGKLIGIGLVIGAAFFLLTSFDMGPDLSTIVDTINDENVLPNESPQTTNSEQATEPKPIIEERHTGQVFQKTDDDCLISIPDKARTINGKKELTYILPVDDCNYDVNEYVEVVFGGELIPDPPADEDTTSPTDTTDNTTDDATDGTTDNTTDDATDGTTDNTTDDATDGTTDNTTDDATVDDDSPNSSDNGGNITIEPHPDVQTFETLSLTTKREGNDVVFQYYDTTNNTISVTVTLRNANEEIFSGTFKSSKFETNVQDVSENTSHIIDLVIDHAVHGKLYSSVYNPPGENNNTINGIFQKK